MSSPKNDPIDIPDLREEIDPEKPQQAISGWQGRFLMVICIASGLFHFYAAGTRPILAVIMFAIHLAFALTIVLWSAPLVKSKATRVVPLYDMIGIAIGLASCVYVMFHAYPIMDFSYNETTIDIVLGTALVILTLEASRRSLGIVFPVLVGLSIAYALFGNMIPGKFGHEGFSWDIIVRNLYVSPQGFWGVMLQISATLVAVFLIFGAVLMKSGGGEAFLDLAFLVSARARGGPAKVAAVSSGLFGMISGSAVANAATIGTFTIPLMKRAGFSANFASAVEAVAGTGGQIMPPIMGAGAFLIAQFLGISYSKVAWAALLPALLYYAGLMFSIHLEALKLNFVSMQMEEEKAIRARMTFKKVGLPLLPIVVLVAAFTTGYTVQMGAFVASILALVLMFFLVDKPGITPRLLEVGKTSLKSMESAGKSIAEIAILLASAQIVVSILGLTGLAVKFSDMLVAIGQANVYGTLFVAMILLIILGMGIPPTAVYVVGASIVAPALTLLGIEPLPAHLFTFYFSCLGAITPPVCAAVFVSSSLAESNWWESGWLAVRLGLAGFIVPFMFIANSSLLLSGSAVDIALGTVSGFAGVFFLAAFAVGYFAGKIGWIKRILLGLAGVLMIHPDIKTSLIGVGIVAAIYALQKMATKKTVASTA